MAELHVRPARMSDALLQRLRPVGDAGQRARVLLAFRDYGIVVSFLVLFVVLSVASSSFFNATNFANILDQSAPLGIIACAGTLVIIAGGFDLSVGAIYATTGIVAAQLVPHVGVVAALLLSVLIGMGLGAANGGLIIGGRFNSFIGTLATQYMIFGLSLILTGGLIVTVADKSFTTLGRGDFLGLAYSVYVWLAFAIACGVLLALTRFGRYVYAAGGNPEAARLSGIPVGFVKAATFAVSGLAAGVAGVIVASRVQSGAPNVGVGLEFSAIAAIAIGGTSILGGAGAVWRTVLGVLLLALIGNGFNLLNISPMYQQIVQGAIILMAVGIDAWARPRRA